jgi:protein involved in polysaccharide export with SLBB domain
VLRTLPDGQRREYTVDLYKALENGDTAADIALKKGDTIFVPAERPHTNMFADAGTGLLYILSRLVP